MMKYNIISNNCVGARIYETTNTQFNNPFIWNCIKLTDFIYLIENFNNINFKNVKSLFTSKEIYKSKNQDKCVTLLIDNIIKLYFIHHNYTDKHLSKKVFRNEKSKQNFNNKLFNIVEYDIEGSDILNYVENCYIKRLYRMLKDDKSILFIYWDSPSYTNDDITKLFKISCKNHIIIISENDYSYLEDNYHHYIKTNNHNTKSMSKIINKYIEDNL